MVVMDLLDLMEIIKPMELELWNWRKWRNLWNNGMELWENGINHKERSNETNWFTERFDGPEDFLEGYNAFEWNKTNRWNHRWECQDWQSWKMFDSCVNFSWFFWEVWLGELATLGMIAINDIKDRIQIKRNWWNCRNSWNENNQPRGMSQKNGTSCQTMGRWGSKVQNFLVKIKTRLF